MGAKPSKGNAFDTLQDSRDAMHTRDRNRLAREGLDIGYMPRRHDNESPPVRRSPSSENRRPRRPLLIQCHES